MSSSKGSGWLSDAFATALDLGKTYLSSGPRLGEFALSDTVLGEGGYGKVYKGVNRTTGEQVAIKEIDTNRMRAANIVKEVATLRRLGRHPNIIGLLGYFELDTKHYIVLEAATGGELFKQVEKRGALPEADARKYFTQLVAGVVHLHKCGVAHRDLKLENVLLDLTEKELKIIDFGLSHAYRPRADGNGFEPEALKHFCGSKSYCPPEMLASVPYNGFAADVYSLGVCLFALLTGFFPLEEACPRDWRFEKLARAQLAGRSTTQQVFTFYRRPCPLSPAAVEVLDGMLQLDPRKRWSLEQVCRSEYVQGRAAASAAEAPSSGKLIVGFPPTPEGAGAGAGAGVGAGSGAGAEVGSAGWDRSLEVDMSLIDAPNRGYMSTSSFSSLESTVDPSYYDDEDDANVTRSLSPPLPPGVQRQQAVSQLHGSSFFE